MVRTPRADSGEIRMAAWIAVQISDHPLHTLPSTLPSCTLLPSAGELRRSREVRRVCTSSFERETGIRSKEVPG